MVKLTHEEYMNKIRDKNIGNYKMLEEYKGYKHIHKILHEDCGTEFEMTGRGFLDYTKRCPKCDTDLKYNRKTFMEAAHEKKSVTGYIMLEEFKSTKKKHKFYHHECGKTFEMKGAEFLYNMNRCPHCCFPIKYNNEEFLEKAKNERNITGYSIKGKYKGFNIDKTKFIHNKCGTEFELTGEGFLYNKKLCPKCSGPRWQKYDKESFMEYAKEKRDITGYSILDEEFHGTQNKHKFYHDECGGTFMMYPSYFANLKYNCPHCSKRNPISKAQREITDFLIENNIEFEREKTYPDLKVKALLRFDFYLNDLDLLIEYDGEQHFLTKPSSRFPIERIKKMKKYDEMKNEYCKKNNLKLYRINYKQDHLKELKNIIKASTTK